jgi:hypothetical protein
VNYCKFQKISSDLFVEKDNDQNPDALTRKPSQNTKPSPLPPVGDKRSPALPNPSALQVHLGDALGIGLADNSPAPHEVAELKARSEKSG